MSVDARDAMLAALGYALWDSENSTRMRASEIKDHVQRANQVAYWLGVHGYKIVKTDKDV